MPRELRCCSTGQFLKRSSWKNQRTWSACACFFLHVIGLPPYTIEVGFPAFARQNDFLTDPFFETAVISLCSGPQVCSPPRSFPPQRLIASGQPGLLSEQNMLRFLRMHRTLLTIRILAIDGVGTYTPQDSQPCRLLQCNGDVSPTRSQSSLTRDRNQFAMQLSSAVA